MADARRKKGLIAPKQPAPLFIAPVQTGEKPADRGIDPLAGREFPLELETVAPGGELLARSGGISFYVDVGCPGQKVLAKVISSSRGNAQARRLQVVEPAPGQAEAFCPHFGVCGGCQWQEIPYPVQLELKQEALTRALINIGGFAPELLKSLMLPPAPSPQIRDFRARMEFAFSLDEQTSFKSASPGAVSKKYPAAKEEGGRTLLGLRRRGAHAVVEVEACPVAPASFLEILREVRAWVKSSGLSAYVPGETGIAGRVLRFLNLRISRLSGKIAVELITFPSPNNARKIAALGKALLERPDICSFTHMTREAEDYLAIGEQTVLHLGEAFLREELGDFKYDLAPGAFFQTNIGVAELLQKMLVELIGKCLENEADASSSVLSGGAAESAAQPEAWDLYSGVGALTFPLAPLFGKVAGFELSSAAVQSARRNAGLNGFSNCRFEAGDVRKLVRRFSGAPKLVVLDPPRAGLAGELVKTLLLKKVPWLIYVSCNPHTLARDLGLLSEKYELKRVQGLDMFPHTHHLETLVLLKRRSG